MGQCCSVEETTKKSPGSQILQADKNNIESISDNEEEQAVLTQNLTKLLLSFLKDERYHPNQMDDITIKKFCLEQLWNIIHLYSIDCTNSESILYDLRDKSKKANNSLKKLKAITYSVEELKLLGEDKVIGIKKFLDNKNLIVILPNNKVTLAEIIIKFMIEKKIKLKIQILDNNLQEETMSINNKHLYHFMDQKYFNDLPFIAFSLKFFPQIKSNSMIFFEKIDYALLSSEQPSATCKYKFSPEFLQFLSQENVGQVHPILSFFNSFQISTIIRVGAMTSEDISSDFLVKKTDASSNHMIYSNPEDYHTCKLITINNIKSQASFLEKKEEFNNLFQQSKFQISSMKSLLFQFDDCLNDQVIVLFLYLFIWKLTNFDIRGIQNYISENLTFIPNIKKFFASNFSPVEELLQEYGYTNVEESNDILLRRETTNLDDLKLIKEKFGYHLKRLANEITNADELNNIVTTLERILLNIIDNYNDEKYYKIKKENKAFKKYIEANQHSLAIFQLFGFSSKESETDREEYYSLSSSTQLPYLKGLYYDYVESVKLFIKQKID